MSSATRATPDTRLTTPRRSGAKRCGRATYPVSSARGAVTSHPESPLCSRGGTIARTVARVAAPTSASITTTNTTTLFMTCILTGLRAPVAAIPHALLVRPLASALADDVAHDVGESADDQIGGLTRVHRAARALRLVEGHLVGGDALLPPLLARHVELGRASADGNREETDREGPHSSTSTFITAPPLSASSMPSLIRSSGIRRLTSGPRLTAPVAARRMASSQSSRA